jgi:hypothetical protein
MLLATFSGTVMDPRHLTASNARLPVIDKTALPFRAGLSLPQIVHCPPSAVGLSSRYGSSGGCQSWSYRLYCMPGAGGGLEQLPHCALSPESGYPQRATIGVEDPRSAAKGVAARTGLRYGWPPTGT